MSADESRNTLHFLKFFFFDFVLAKLKEVVFVPCMGKEEVELLEHMSLRADCYSFQDNP